MGFMLTRGGCLPVPKLIWQIHRLHSKRQVPELKGLRPATNQDDLPNLLARVGANVDQLSRKIPNLTAEEQVTMIPCCSPAIRMTYQYIAISRETPTGRVLDEVRTDARIR